MKLSEAQKAFLQRLVDEPTGNGGIIIPDGEDKTVLWELMNKSPELVSDVYSWPLGGITVRITAAGRATLSQQQEGKDR